MIDKPALEGVCKLSDRTGSHVVGHSERHVAGPRNIKSPECAIEYREDGREVAAGACDVARMMPAVHGRRYEHCTAAAICPWHIRMDEFAVIVPNELVRHNRPGRRAEQRKGRIVDECCHQAVDRMESVSCEPGHLRVAVVNCVRRPKPSRVFESMPPVREEISHEHGYQQCCGYPYR